MASISKMMKTKDGKRYWRIQVSRGKGNAPYSTRFYWPLGKNGSPVSEKTAVNARDSFATNFENDCKAGKIMNNEQKRQLEEQRRQEEEREKEERARLKTVRDYTENVFMATKRLELAETTRASYQSTIDLYINPVIGDTLLVDITPAMLKKVLLDFQLSGKSVSSARILYVVLNGIFQSAFYDDSIPTNPMMKCPKPKMPKDAAYQKESAKALDVDTLLYVLACADSEYQDALQRFAHGLDKERKNVYSSLLWKTYIELAADTGCRRGELVALKWTDINWDDACITIERNAQYTPQKGVYITTPKSGKTRVIDIGAETISLLKKFGEEQSAHHLSPWVFSQEGTAEPLHPDSPTRYFKKFGAKYGIANFHPHLLRHSSASIAITEAGADIVSVSARLGHSDSSITVRMYTHPTDQSVRRAGQGVRDVLKKRMTQNTKKAEGQ